MATATLTFMIGPSVTVTVTYDNVTMFASGLSFAKTPAAVSHTLIVGTVAGGVGATANVGIHQGVMATAIPTPVALAASTYSVKPNPNTGVLELPNVHQIAETFAADGVTVVSAAARLYL